MSDVINTEELAKVLGLGYREDGYSERSLAALHAELRLATELVWKRLLGRQDERMDLEDGRRQQLRRLEELEAES